MLKLPLLAAAISALGQVMLKYAMIKHGAIEFSLQGLISLLFEARLVAALILYAVALLMWLHVLSKIPLSAAYPILSVTYVLVPFLSVAFLDESINQNQLIGICLVLAGVAMMGKAV